MDLNGKVIVDFYADWCGPCKAIAGYLTEIESEYGVGVIRLNVDEDPQTTQSYGVQSIPTLILFQDGEEVERIIGASPKMDVVARFNL